MADNNPSSILKSIAGLIQASVGSSSNSAYDCKEDVEELRRMGLRIRATLDDAEDRDVKDEAVKLWLKELKDLAYDAEDLVDEYDYELLRSEVAGRQKRSETTHKRKREEVCNLITSTISIPDHDFEDRSKEIRKRFDEITRDRDALRLTEEDGEKLSDRTAKLPPTTSFVHEAEVYGREQDKEKVIKLLFAEGESSQGNSLSVIPIIGMGGIGKTTLAQLVYNDPRVCQYFNHRGWVCVSENFDVSRLLKEIFESLTKAPCNRLMNTDVLCQNLRRQLNGKSFLLVLDDVWNEKPGLWESVKAPLSHVGIGNIIVTTRHESVARIMHATSTLPYRLGCLPEDICWSLFWDRAFEGRDPDEYGNLAEIGKKIVRKCGGLPLAVRTLGGLLRFETDEERWADVLDSDLWGSDERKDDILPALKLSYIRMPAHLKRCFLYCSMFPKDYWFKKDYIVKLWMSQGLIRSRGRQELEDIGNAYFEELTWRSFFQSPENFGFYYVMHDLLHDLAQSMAKEECYSSEIGLSYNLPKRVRHLSLFFPSKAFCSEEYFEPLIQYRDIRTLDFTPKKFAFATSTVVAIQNNLFQNLTCLRALSLSYIKELPDSVGNLKHLRSLCLRQTNIRRLPDSICCLYNLLALEVDSSELEELPKDMKNLINLRHLDMGGRHLDGGASQKIYLPPGIGQVTSLQTLIGFRVGRDDQHCGIRQLRDLVHLRGRLQIRGLENVASLEDAKEAKMDNKRHLESLELWWSIDPSSYQGDEQTLENLRPHTNLKELTIWGYRGSRSPSWLCEPSFSKLLKVVLANFRPSFAILPPLGRLPCLKDLEIREMRGVRSIGREFCVGDSAAATGFPSLEDLVFVDMPEWVEWHGVKDADFPCLQGLTLALCPKLKSLELFSINDRLPPLMQPVDVWGSPGVRKWCQRKGIPYKDDTEDEENDEDDQDNEYSEDDEQ